jgi:hypothetical protein
MNDLSIVVDPGGIDGVRPGINVVTYPNGDVPVNWSNLSTSTERLANGNLKMGGWDERLELSWSAALNATEYNKIMALMTYNKQAKSMLKPWETVIYILVEPYTEISENRTRYKVPDTTVKTQQDLGLNKYLWEYYVAVQGNLRVSEVKRKGKLYFLNFSFKEGTKLTSDMED